MTIRLLLQWWYGPGFGWVFRGLLVEKLRYIADVFSVKEMITTLFAPFRQTYVGKASGVSKLQAFADRSVSRAIGFVVRLLLILTATIAAVIVLVIGLVLTVSWPLLPLLPVVSIILAITGFGA